MRSQLKLEISSEDLIVPDDKHFNEVSDTLSSSEVDSAKLDFVRRRRRKMMTSTVSPSLKVSGQLHQHPGHQAILTIQLPRKET